MSIASSARQSRFPWLIVGVGCMSGFMGQLDASIVQLALPALTQTFDSTVNAVRWVAIAYLLAYASFILVFARLSRIWNRKWVFVAGFAIFTVASLLCGLAPGLHWLILFRAIQGFGGAMMGANSISIVMQAATPEQRGHAIGMFTACQAIGVSAGPVAGGLLLDSLGWQWVFWASVPFGCVATLLSAVVLESSASPAAGDRHFDWSGVLLLVPGLLLFILALNQVSVWPVLSPAMLTCAGAAVLCLAMFVRRVRSAPQALINRALFRNAAFARGLAGIVLANAALYGMFFLMSFALIHGLHESARLAGLKLAVIPIAIGVTAPLSAVLAARWGHRVATVGGMLLCTAAVVIVAIIALKPAGTLLQGLGAFALFGIGLGLFVGPNSHATTDAAPADRTSEAGAMLNLSRVLGSCIGVSCASTLMSLRMSLAKTDELAVAFSGLRLLAAIEVSLVVLAIFAVTAAAMSLFKPGKSA